MRKTLLLGLAGVTILLIVLGAILLSASDDSGSRVKVSVQLLPSSINSFTVLRGDETISVPNNPATITLPKGNVTLIVQAKDYTETQLDLTVGDTNEPIRIVMTPQNDAEAAKTLLESTTDGSSVTATDGLVARDVKYFENNTWIVGTLFTTDRSTDGEMAILKKIGSTWQVVLVGTGIDRESMLQENVPESVQKHLEASR